MKHIPRRTIRTLGKFAVINFLVGVSLWLIMTCSSSVETARDYIIFTDFGPFTDHSVFSVLFARYANPSDEIVILTNNLKDWTDMTFLQSENIHFADLSDPIFADISIPGYRHSSSNVPEFEVNCLRRFMWMDAYVSSLPVPPPSVAHLDMDLVVFDKGPRQLDERSDVWSLHYYSTYFTRFRPSALKNFSMFISEFYKVDNETLARQIAEHGNRFASDKIRQKIEARGHFKWIPPDIDVPKMQFSDMHIERAWLITSGIKFSVQHESHFNMPVRSLFIQKVRSGLNDSLACQDGHVPKLEQRWNWTKTSEGWRFPQFGEQSLWAIHFQGVDCKQRQCEVLCDKVKSYHQSYIPCCGREYLDNYGTNEAETTSAPSTKKKAVPEVSNKQAKAVTPAKFEAEKKPAESEVVSLNEADYASTAGKGGAATISEINKESSPKHKRSPG